MKETRLLLLLLASTLTSVGEEAKSARPEAQSRDSIKIVNFAGESSPATPQDEYVYHKDTALALGRGFDPSDPTEFKFPCIEKQEERLDSGPPDTSLTSYYVNNASQVQYAASVDTSIEARYLGNSAKFTSQYSTSTLSSDRAITIVMTAKTDFGRWALKPGVHLTSDAQKLLTENPAKFASDCGTRYVAAERRGASASAFITILAVSRDFKSAFNNEMSASGGWGPLSGNASQMFKKELRTASTQDRVDVRVFATGGKGLGSLDELVKKAVQKPEAVDAIGSALGVFISTFNSDNAAPIVYRTASMEHFGWDPASAIGWSTEKEIKLRTLANSYNTIYRGRELAQAMVDGSHPLAALSPGLVDDFKIMIPQADAYLARLESAHARCKANASASTGDCDIPVIGRMTFEPFTSMVDSYMQPARLTLLSPALGPEETRIVLNVPPDRRLSEAKLFNRDITGFGAMLQLDPEAKFVLSWRLDFRGRDDDVWHLIADVPGNAGVVWWGSSSPADDLEAKVKGMMASWEGTHDGSLYGVVQSKTKQVYSAEFMKVHWKTSHGTLVEYEYELVY